MFPSYLEVEKKTGSQLFQKMQPDLFKHWLLIKKLFGERQTLLHLFVEMKKWIPAIWRPKNVVHNCQEQGKVRL